MSLETRVTRVLVELERLNYSTLSQTRYRQFYQRVLRYAREQGLANYSEEVGRQFLAASYECDGLNLPHPVPGKLHVPLRGIAMLGDMHLHGMIRRRHTHHESVGLPPPKSRKVWRPSRPIVSAVDIHRALGVRAPGVFTYSGTTWSPISGRSMLLPVPICPPLSQPCWATIPKL